MLHTHSLSTLFHITSVPNQTQPSSSSSTISNITTPFPITFFISKFKFLFIEPSGLSPHRPITHHILLLPHSNPVNVKPYHYPNSQKAKLERQVSSVLDAGLIQLSKSPFSSPMLLVKKKDDSWRCYIGYHALNVITVKDRFPMPTIDELLDELGEASWFSKLDLRQGFHQIRMVEIDIPKTAFLTHQGHYKYRVMPFGLCNALATFRATMNKVLKPFLCKFNAIFFNDILIYSSSLPYHVQHLEAVFVVLAEAQFHLRQSKCLFARKNLQNLGHIVSTSGVAPEPAKIPAMVDWPTPSSTIALWGFLGLTNFNRRFIRGYA